MPKVKVPQQDGEVRISHQGNPPVVFAVEGGTITVGDADTARMLVEYVAGAELLEDLGPAQTARPGIDPETGGPAPLELPPDAPPAAAQTGTLSDDDLRALPAAQLVAFVQANPAERDRVAGLERARTEPRSSVLKATAGDQS